MGGKPNPEGVQRFRLAVSRMDVAARRMSDLRVEIALKTGDLKREEQEYQLARDSMFDLMKEMDVASSGNAGWDGRIAWFFTEMHRQFAADNVRPVAVE